MQWLQVMLFNFSNFIHQVSQYNVNNLHSFVWFYNRLIGLEGRVFTNGLRDQGSIPGQVIPKIQKMVLDASLLNTQHYKVWVKG